MKSLDKYTYGELAAKQANLETEKEMLESLTWIGNSIDRECTYYKMIRDIDRQIKSTNSLLNKKEEEMLDEREAKNESNLPHIR